MARSTFLLSAFVAVLLLSVAEAQQPPRGQRGGLGGLTSDLLLVRNDAVQKELSLSKDQTGKLRELLVAYQKDAAEIPQLSREELQKLSQEERQKKLRENREAVAKVQEKYQGQVGKILDKAQSERLGQIRLQVQGPTAVTTPDVAEKLGLSREERQKIQTAIQQLTQAARQGDARPTAEQRANLREKLEAKIKELLSDDQLAKFNELQGKPFDVSQLRQRGPRRQNNN